MTAADAGTNEPEAEASMTGAKPVKARDSKEQAASRAQRFIADIRKLYTDNTGRGRGELAALRRNAGNTLALSRDTTWFYRYLNRYVGGENSAYTSDRNREEETFFLVATLYAGDKTAQEKEIREQGDLGHSMRHLRPQSDAASKNEVSDPSRRDRAERRLGALLDAQWDQNGGELAFRLRQTVKLLTSQKILINWPLLLEDLLKWDHPNKTVQKRWARNFYAVPPAFAPDDADAPPKTGELDDASSEAVPEVFSIDESDAR